MFWIQNCIIIFQWKICTSIAISECPSYCNLWMIIILLLFYKVVCSLHTFPYTFTVLVTQPRVLQKLFRARGIPLPGPTSLWFYTIQNCLPLLHILYVYIFVRIACYNDNQHMQPQVLFVYHVSYWYQWVLFWFNKVE